MTFNASIATETV